MTAPHPPPTRPPGPPPSRTSAPVGDLPSGRSPWEPRPSGSSNSAAHSAGPPLETSGAHPTGSSSQWRHHQFTDVADADPSDPGTQHWSTRLQAATPPALQRLLGPITGLGAAAIVLVVLCAVVGWLTGWTEFVVAAVAVATLLLVATVFLIGRSSYSVRIDLHSARVIAGVRATGSLSVRNTGGRRLLSSRMELPVGTAAATFRIPSLAGGEEHEELFVIPTARRAVIEVGPALSVRGDAMGLLRRQVRWTTADELYVHPRTIALHGAATGSVKDLEGRPTTDLSSNDVSFHALRQYVPGDDRRYVHWKTSARTGTLMVRQFEETRRTHLAVALSVDPTEYGTVEEFELAVSAAASLSSQAVREERPVTVCAGPTTLRAASGRRLLDVFSAVEPRDDAGILVAGRQTSAAVPNASVAVLITGSVPDATTLRRSGLGFSVGIRVVALRIVAGAPVALRAIGRVDVATVGSLDDLASAMRRLKAA